MNIRTQIGPVTAYADAMAAGYTGTREQWAEDMAKLGENVAAVRTEREKAENAAQTAVGARDTAVQTINTARDAAVQTVNNAAETAEDAAVESIEQAAAEKVGEINGIGAVRFDGFQPLTEDEQATARSNIDAGGAIVETAQGDGTVTVEDSAHAALHGLRVFGKSTQDGTPSPDAPVPIVSVGDDGEITVKNNRKNLFDPSRLLEASGWTEENGVYSGTNTSLNAVFNSSKGGYMKIATAGRPMTFSFDFYSDEGDGTGQRTYFYFNYDDGTKTTLNVNSNVEPKHYTVTTAAKKKSFVLAISFGTSANIHFSNIQLEFGDTETAYEPYTGQTLPISTPNGLPGIPVDSGGNYTDADGQQWVCDEVDFGRGVYVQRVFAVIFNGTQGWYPSNTYNGYIRMRHITQGSSELLSPSVSTAVGVIRCSRYPSISAQLLYTEKTGIALDTDSSLYVYDDNYQSADAFMAHLAENPMYVQGIYATPIETPLTTEELAAYRALRTQYPTTNIINDEGAGMEIAYTADTKTYIDNKFAELSAAILNA